MIRKHTTIYITTAILLAIIFILTSCSADTDSRQQFVFLGDSITCESGGNDTISTCYVTYIRQLWREYDLDVISSGVSGDKAYYFYKDPERVAQRVTAYEPEYVLIYLGTNDWVLGDASLFRDHYNYLIDEILNQNPNIKQVFLVKFSWAYLPGTDNRFAPRDLDLAADYQMAISTIAYERNLPLIDLWSLTEDRPDLLADGLHPNEHGAEIIAEYIDSIVSGW